MRGCFCPVTKDEATHRAIRGQPSSNKPNLALRGAAMPGVKEASFGSSLSRQSIRAAVDSPTSSRQVSGIRGCAVVQRSKLKQFVLRKCRALAVLKQCDSEVRDQALSLASRPTR